MPSTKVLMPYFGRILDDQCEESPAARHAVWRRLALVSFAAGILGACDTPTAPTRAAVRPELATSSRTSNGPSCIAAPLGMVHWLPADGAALDIVGNNHGTLQNGATFGPGLVGQAFSFNGVSSVQLSPLPNVSTFGSVTVDLWINVVSYSSGAINDGAGSSFIDRLGETFPLFGLKAVAGQFGLQVRYDDLSGLGGPVGGTIVPGQWTHVAIVRDYPIAFHLYVDGALVASTPDNARSLRLSELKLGHHNQAALLGFVGLIDELAIFSRALSPGEIHAIVAAGSAGKCSCALTAITTQPAGATKSVGEAVTFAVTATGTALSYQWKKDGVDIVGATSASYSIASVTSSYAGDYSVVVADCGSVTSAPATLAVTKSDQTLAFAPIPDKTYGDAPFVVSAIATSGLVVSFAVIGNCTVAGSTVTIVAAGSCTVTASQPGDDNYNASPNVQHSFTIAHPAVEIEFSLHGSAGTANPATLFLDGIAPSGTTAKYKDSPSIRLAGGNLWKQVGTWTARPDQTTGQLSVLGDTRLWLGLKNSDDQGTRFDVRVEVLRNGGLVALGESYCIQGVTRNPNSAFEVSVAFAPFASTSFNGATDVMSLRVLTRIGTNGSGVHCGGHSNAVGLRVYFDSPNRLAKFAATF